MYQTHKYPEFEKSGYSTARPALPESSLKIITGKDDF